MVSSPAANPAATFSRMDSRATRHAAVNPRLVGTSRTRTTAQPAGCHHARHHAFKVSSPAERAGRFRRAELARAAGCGHVCAMASYIVVAGAIVGILVGVTQLID